MPPVDPSRPITIEDFGPHGHRLRLGTMFTVTLSPAELGELVSQGADRLDLGVFPKLDFREDGTPRPRCRSTFVPQTVVLPRETVEAVLDATYRQIAIRVTGDPNGRARQARMLRAAADLEDELATRDQQA
jgi:hypothetical protein